jgi:hypothetical protein
VAYEGGVLGVANQCVNDTFLGCGLIYKLSPATTTPSDSITITPGELYAGQTATISWTSSNATTCEEPGGATSGSKQVTFSGDGLTLPATIPVWLFCSGDGGTTASVATVLVKTPPPPTVTLQIAPNSIVLGQTASVSWTTSYADSCTASGAWTGSEPVTSKLNVSPASSGTLTYVLTCTSVGGSTTASQTLTVAPAGKSGGGSFGLETLIGLSMLLIARHRRLLDVHRRGRSSSDRP